MICHPDTRAMAGTRRQTYLNRCTLNHCTKDRNTNLTTSKSSGIFTLRSPVWNCCKSGIFFLSIQLGRGTSAATTCPGLWKCFTVQMSAYLTMGLSRGQGVWRQIPLAVQNTVAFCLMWQKKKTKKKPGAQFLEGQDTFSEDWGTLD